VTLIFTTSRETRYLHAKALSSLYIIILAESHRLSQQTKRKGWPWQPTECLFVYVKNIKISMQDVVTAVVDNDNTCT